MPNYVRQWKINRQIADLRDGTKGQPNGAVPLDASGKLAYSLAKYTADQIAVSRENTSSIAEWARNVSLYTVLPTSWATRYSGVFQRVECVNGVFVAAGSSGIVYSKDGYTWHTTNVTGFSSSVDIAFIVYLGGAYYVGNNLGLWRSTDLTTWTTVINVSVTHIAYDGTKFECATIGQSSCLVTSTEGVTWTTDTFFSSLGAVDTDNYNVWGVWFIDGVWWLNAYYTTGRYHALFFYDGTHFSQPVTVGATQNIKWKYIHHTRNVEGLFRGDIWLIVSEGEYGYGKLFYSETLYGVQWTNMGDLESATTPFVEHKGKLFIGTRAGIATFYPISNYYFLVDNLTDVIGENPCNSLFSTGDLLIVCGGRKLLYSVDAVRWYRGIADTNCYFAAYGDNHLVLIGYNTTINNALLFASVLVPEPLYL